MHSAGLISSAAHQQHVLHKALNSVINIAPNSVLHKTLDIVIHIDLKTALKILLHIALRMHQNSR